MTLPARPDHGTSRQAAGTKVPGSAVRIYPLHARTQDDEPYTAPPTLEELREICRGLLDALAEEARAASAVTLALGAGRRLDVVGAGSRYRFERAPGPIDASTGDPVLLRLGARETEGSVAATDDSAIEVTITDDLGLQVSAGAELLLDAPWLIERLRRRVREAFAIGVHTPHLFNLTNALRTLGVGEIPVTSSHVAPAYDDVRRPLNEDQAQAIVTAFRSPLSVIAAPAGTGKTVTIGALIEACYRAGLRVLVTAPSNVAVDLQMMQVCSRLAGEPGFNAAEVLRVGAGVGAELVASHGPQVVLDSVIARLRNDLRARRDRLERAVHALAAKLSEAQQAGKRDADREVRQYRAKLDAARQELREVQLEARDFGRRLASEGRVVGATLARVHLDPSLRGYDVVVIDEASMAQGPEVFFAAGLARRHVVVAGDPYQLAAPVRSSGVQRHWLAVDVFHRLDVVRAIRDEEDVPYLTELTEQRRSAEGICELQRTLWYGPRLRTAPEVRARERKRPLALFGAASICYIDTSPLKAQAYRPWSGTYANDAHAALIADVVAHLDAAGELPEASGDGDDVLVLSHYRGQTRNLRRCLHDYRDRGVSVRTVHRSQGSEARTCVFDLTLTASQPVRSSSVLTATQPQDEGSRLLAVAASRARSRFLFVGDLRWIERSVNPASVLSSLCAHLREHGQAITVEEIRRGAPPPRLRVLL